MTADNVQILRVATHDQLMRAGAERFARFASEAVEARGRFSVALSGGSTPKGVYELLSGRGGDWSRELSSRVPWDRVDVFFGDERYVPADDPQSNYRMAREALLDHVPIPASQIHPIGTDAAEPEQAAVAYAATIRKVLSGDSAADGDSVPRFDLVMLGLGPDGHTASLFPGTAVVHQTQRLVVAHYVAKFEMYRVTLTPPILCAGRHIEFLAAGDKKADRVRDVIEGPHDPDKWPAQIIRPAGGQLTWLVDRAAAAELSVAVQDVERRLAACRPDPETSF